MCTTLYFTALAVSFYRFLLQPRVACKEEEKVFVCLFIFCQMAPVCSFILYRCLLIAPRKHAPAPHVNCTVAWLSFKPLIGVISSTPLPRDQIAKLERSPGGSGHFQTGLWTAGKLTNAGGAYSYKGPGLASELWLQIKSELGRAPLPPHWIREGWLVEPPFPLSIFGSQRKDSCIFILLCCRNSRVGTLPRQAEHFWKHTHKRCRNMNI